MDYKELLKKYNHLLNENSRLTAENNILKAKLEIKNFDFSQNSLIKKAAGNTHLDGESIGRNCFLDVSRKSDTFLKIRLFMSLFKGRDDVYAKRWENKSKGTSGYTPVCLNQWQPGLCGKPRISCSKCEHKLYEPLDEGVIEKHLRGGYHCWYLSNVAG